MKNTKKPSTLKRILAWAGIILLVSLYVITFILGVFASPAAKDWFMVSLICTVVIPVLMYAMMLLARLLSGKDDPNQQ